ncbi:MAG: hypothetical protein AB9872_00185 [Solidesulfovibrio sp.]
MDTHAPMSTINPRQSKTAQELLNEQLADMHQSWKLFEDELTGRMPKPPFRTSGSSIFNELRV